MHGALRLYASLGFIRCPGYYDTPLAETCSWSCAYASRRHPFRTEASKPGVASIAERHRCRSVCIHTKPLLLPFVMSTLTGAKPVPLWEPSQNGCVFGMATGAPVKAAGVTLLHVGATLGDVWFSHK